MKITGVETFQVAPRRMFVKVSPDSGISGWGEGGLEGLPVHELLGGQRL